METQLCPACSTRLSQNVPQRCLACRAVLRLGERRLPPLAVIQLAEQVKRTGYSWDAFEFMLRGIPLVFVQLRGRDQVRKHVDAASLCWGLIEHAVDRFGTEAAGRLESCGLHNSRHLGEVVFALAGVGYVQISDADAPAAFDGVLSVREAIEQILLKRPFTCRHCGYDLRATPDRCPECGTVPAA